MVEKGLFLALVAGALAIACGGDDDKRKTDGGTTTGGATGGGGKGGSGGSTGGTAGATATGGVSGGGGSGATGGTGGGTGGGTACGDYGQVEECKTCLAEKCCTEGGNCKKEPDCDAMVTCARACPTPSDTSSACVQQCAAQHNLGGTSFNPLILCMSNLCGTICGYL